MTPWWRRPAVILNALWIVACAVRWSHGRLWGAGAEPGSHLFLFLLAAGLISFLGAVRDKAPDPVIAQPAEPPLAWPKTHPGEAHGLRHALLRGALAALGALLLGVFSVRDDRRRAEALLGVVAVAVTIGAVVLGASLIERASLRRPSPTSAVLAPLLVTVLVSAGVFAAFAQGAYAQGLRLTGSPAQAVEQSIEWAGSALSSVGALALGAGVASGWLLRAQLRGRLLGPDLKRLITLALVTIVLGVLAVLTFGVDALLPLFSGVGMIAGLLLMQGTGWLANALEARWVPDDPR